LNWDGCSGVAPGGELVAGHLSAGTGLEIDFYLKNALIIQKQDKKLDYLYNYGSIKCEI
jgi:hypothetical protein